MKTLWHQLAFVLRSVNIIGKLKNCQLQDCWFKDSYLQVWSLQKSVGETKNSFETADISQKIVTEQQCWYLFCLCFVKKCKNCGVTTIFYFLLHRISGMKFELHMYYFFVRPFFLFWLWYAVTVIIAWNLLPFQNWTKTLKQVEFFYTPLNMKKINGFRIHF